MGICRGDLAFAAERASASRQWTLRTTRPAIRAESLSTFAMVEVLLGRPAQDLMTEAVRLEDLAMREAPGSQATVFTASRTCHGLQLLWAGELDAAREVLHQELAEYESLGRYVVRDELLTYLAEVECRAGNWDVAARHAQEAYEIDVESGWVLGLGHMLFPGALVAALKGDVDTARSDAEEGLRQSLRNEDMLDASCNRTVLGFLELSLSNPGAAMERLGPVLAFLDEMGSPEPGVIPCVPDAVEALVSLGEAGRGRGTRRSSGAPGTNPRSAVGHRHGRARGRGLLTAARGDLSAARSALEQALVEHRRVQRPIELARTLLVKGEVERRAKQKRPPAPPWSRRLVSSRPSARRSGRRGAGRPRPCRRRGAGVQRAHPTEQRIAQLVGEGKKNREVADALFISVKTVEANLSRIFHKLGVRSRTELTRRIAGTHRVSPDSSPPHEG